MARKLEDLNAEMDRMRANHAAVIEKLHTEHEKELIARKILDPTMSERLKKMHEKLRVTETRLEESEQCLRDVEIERDGAHTMLQGNCPLTNILVFSSLHSWHFPP